MCEVIKCHTGDVGEGKVWEMGRHSFQEEDSPPDANTHTPTPLLRVYRAPPDPWETETEWETTPFVHGSV